MGDPLESNCFADLQSTTSNLCCTVNNSAIAVELLERSQFFPLQQGLPHITQRLEHILHITLLHQCLVHPFSVYLASFAVSTVLISPASYTSRDCLSLPSLLLGGKGLACKTQVNDGGGGGGGDL
jgi:hypothetical protein